jgi:hypothetical protein
LRRFDLLELGDFARVGARSARWSIRHERLCLSGPWLAKRAVLTRRVDRPPFLLTLAESQIELERTERDLGATPHVAQNLPRPDAAQSSTRLAKL